ncbi:hypothetical protein BKA93DRAFT_444134 [Sparassis latifolia]
MTYFGAFYRFFYCYSIFQRFCVIVCLMSRSKFFSQVQAIAAISSKFVPLDYNSPTRGLPGLFRCWHIRRRSQPVSTGAPLRQLLQNAVQQLHFLQWPAKPLARTMPEKNIYAGEREEPGFPPCRASVQSELHLYVVGGSSSKSDLCPPLQNRTAFR